MCGRFTHHLSWAEIHRLYNLTAEGDIARNTAPRYNISPTEDVLFVRAGEDDGEVLDEGRWWLVPPWAKEVPKYPMFNARAETAATKPAFREAFRTGRCLIPADGYFEWTKGEDGGRDPWYLHLPGGRPFSFAGLWARNERLGLTSCTILTAPAVAPIDRLHHRMPVILAPDAYGEWLSSATGAEAAAALLARHLDGELAFHRVSRQVNATRFEGASAIAPLDAEPPGPGPGEDPPQRDLFG
ncbi:SOS response-associated peptidase [Paroceanicella profunda]|uniref:Abasic site processing protein n=1 Tax=Paroceanicella profunda TaxID=2579971 RepID=A0A5B8FH59_9RHOB|nr:SOS response-associated peptidase [Paroceanicella profunda]QDL91807.1 SOS response-associated peptidase [Paroceanicella profunda]